MDCRSNDFLATVNQHPADRRVIMTEDHKYWLDGNVQLASVSAVTAQHFSEFRPDEQSLRMAPLIFVDSHYLDYARQMRERGLSPESHPRQIAAALESCWIAKRDNGTARHALQESFWNQPEHTPETYQRLVGDRPLDAVHKQCLAFACVALARGWSIFRTEWRIFSPEYGVAGTIDAVFRDQNGQLVIVDWKFEDNINKPGWGFGTGPCSGIRESKRNKHFLQVNCYRALLEAPTYGAQVAGCAVVVFSEQQSSFLEDAAPDWRTLARDVLSTSPFCPHQLTEFDCEPSPATTSPDASDLMHFLQRGENVMLQAVPGAGKTQLAATVAKHFPRHLIITYNRDLVDRLNADGIHAHTFHSLLGELTDTVVSDDELFLQSLESWQGTPRDKLQPDLLVLDEAQDLRPLYAQFVLSFLRQLPSAPLLLVMGDPNQLLYDYILGGCADSRFLTAADQWLQPVTTRAWNRVFHWHSFRCPEAAAGLVRRLRPEVPMTGHGGGQMVVVPCFLRTAAPAMAVHLAQKYPNLLVLSRSLRKGSPSVAVANALRKAQTSARVMTMHAAKGLQSDFVLVLAEEPLQPPISNALYVALTRASVLLVVLQERFPVAKRSEKIWARNALARCDPMRLRTLRAATTTNHAWSFSPVADAESAVVLAIQLHYGRLLPECKSDMDLWRRTIELRQAADLVALSNIWDAQDGDDSVLDRECQLSDSLLSELLGRLPPLTGHITFGKPACKKNLSFHVVAADKDRCVAICDNCPEVFAALLQDTSQKQATVLCLASGQLICASCPSPLGLRQELMAANTAWPLPDSSVKFHT